MMASKELFDLTKVFLFEKSEYVTLHVQNGIFPTLCIGDMTLGIDDDGVAILYYQSHSFSFSKEQTEEIVNRFDLIHNERTKQRDNAIREKTEKRLREFLDSKKLIKESKV